MAKGKKCPCCGYYMYAQSEDNQEKGRWVVYVCRNGACTRCGSEKQPKQCNHQEKVFESYAF